LVYHNSWSWEAESSNGVSVNRVCLLIYNSFIAAVLYVVRMLYQCHPIKYTKTPIPFRLKSIGLERVLLSILQCVLNCDQKTTLKSKNQWNVVAVTDTHRYVSGNIFPVAIFFFSVPSRAPFTVTTFKDMFCPSKSVYSHDLWCKPSINRPRYFLSRSLWPPFENCSLTLIYYIIF